MRGASDSSEGTELPDELEVPTLPPRVRNRPDVLPSRQSLTPAGVSRTHLPPPGKASGSRVPRWASGAYGAVALVALAVCFLYVAFSGYRVAALSQAVTEADREWVEQGLRGARGVRMLVPLGVAAPAELDGWVADMKSEADIEAQREAASALGEALAEAIEAVPAVPLSETERIRRAEAYLEDLRDAERFAKDLHAQRYDARMSIGGRVVRLVGIVE